MLHMNQQKRIGIFDAKRKINSSISIHRSIYLALAAKLGDARAANKVIREWVLRDIKNRLSSFLVTEMVVGLIMEPDLRRKWCKCLNKQKEKVR